MDRNVDGRGENAVVTASWASRSDLGVLEDLCSANMKIAKNLARKS
jgi:hypothetical protein